MVRNYIYKHTLLVMITGLLLLTGLWSGLKAQEEPVFESFNISIFFDKIGKASFPALISEDNIVFYPVNNIFDYLKINNKVSADGKTIEGYLLIESNKYSIDVATKQATYAKQLINLSDKEIVTDMGIVYMSKDALNRVFGMIVDFNFRALSANFGAPYEFPLARIIKQEKARENIRKVNDIVIADTIYKRQYHWFRPGMLDWSITSNQSQSGPSETRFGLGLGAEAFGGETNLWLNYSDRFGFNRNQQRYHWRWVDNSFKYARQVQIGRIYNRSISTLLFPVDGFSVTNTPTTIRKALGSHYISDNTQPDWIVELYINNVLIDFTKADASGFFSFEVPVMYGSTGVTLRYYGPNGEEKSQEKTYYMPFNMLPKGEFEYRVSGGTLLDTLYTKYARVETNYGISKWLTAGAGYEYLGSITNNPNIPFANFTFQPFAKFILTGEYAYKVRTKATLNYSFLKSSALELSYSIYEKDQKAIIYNYLEERVAALSFPVRFNKFPTFTRATFRQNVYPNFSYTSGEMITSAYYRNFNGNFSTFANWTDFGTSNYYSALSLGLRFGKGNNIRPTLQYSYSAKNILSYKLEYEKQIGRNGNLTMAYEQNFLVNYRSFNVAYRHDLNFMSAYASVYYADKKLQTAQSARGSLTFNTGNKYVHADRQDAVGRAGIAIIPFVDTNFNGVKDSTEKYIADLNVRSNGGRIIKRDNDSIIRVVGLEPFVEYVVTLDESNFQNIAWRLGKHTIKVLTDPNQFKRIYTPVLPMGEATGLTVDMNHEPMGRILLEVKDTTGNVVAKTESEFDGYFSVFGLRPGNYTVSVDTVQLNRIQCKSEPVAFKINPNEIGDLVDVGEIMLISMADTDGDGVKDYLDKCPGTPKAAWGTVDEHGCPKDSDGDGVPDYLDKCPDTPKEAWSTVDAKGCPKDSDGDGVPDYLDKCPDVPGLVANNGCPEVTKEIKTLFRKALYGTKFNLGKATIIKSSYTILNQVAEALKANPGYKTEVRGHTDIVGGDKVNVPLSNKRAKAVMDYLIRRGVAANQLTSAGYSSSVPVATNKTAAGRALNRRVEFVVTFEEVKTVKEVMPATSKSIDVKMQNKTSNVSALTTPTVKLATKSAVMSDSILKSGIVPNVVKPIVQTIRNDAPVDTAKTVEQAIKNNLIVTNASDIINQTAQIIEKNLKPVLDSVTVLKKTNLVDSLPVAVKELLLDTSTVLKSTPKSNILKYEASSTIGEVLIIRNNEGKFYMQVGSFKSKENALRLYNQLHEVLPVHTIMTKNGSYYKVRVGYFDTRAEAEQAAKKIVAIQVLKNEVYVPEKSKINSAGKIGQEYLKAKQVKNKKEANEIFTN